MRSITGSAVDRETIVLDRMTVFRRLSGSTNGVGLDFQPFRISDLKMVDQTGVSWNHVGIWLRGIDAIRACPRRVPQ
jgi:hypothetical protein